MIFNDVFFEIDSTLEVKTLHGIFSRIADHPEESKFRSLRKSNARFAAEARHNSYGEVSPGWTLFSSDGFDASCFILFCETSFLEALCGLRRRC